MYQTRLAAGGTRRPELVRSVAGPKAVAARIPLTCRWSRDPATGKIVATWIRAAGASASHEHYEPEPSRLRPGPLTRAFNGKRAA